MVDAAGRLHRLMKQALMMMYSTVYEDATFARSRGISVEDVTFWVLDTMTTNQPDLSWDAPLFQSVRNAIDDVFAERPALTECNLAWDLDAAIASLDEKTLKILAGKLAEIPPDNEPTN